MKKSELLALLGERVKNYRVEKVGGQITVLIIEVDEISWWNIKLTEKYILEIKPKDEYTLSIIYDTGDEMDTIELD